MVEPVQKSDHNMSDSDSEMKTEIQEKQPKKSNKLVTKIQRKQTKNLNSIETENVKNMKIGDASKPEPSPKKRGRGKEDTKEPESKKQKTEPVAEVDTDISKLDFTKCDRQTTDGKTWNLKISSWNVAGLRACVKVSIPFFYNYT